MKRTYLLLIIYMILTVGVGNSMEIKYIVMADEPSRWDIKAAQEINHYAEKITGNKLRKYKFSTPGRPQKSILYIGEAARQEGLIDKDDIKKIKLDGYLIITKEGNTGIYGPVAAGVLFGAYGLLSETGVKIYGEDCEILPEKLILPANLKKIVNPAFEMRCMEAGFWRWNKYYRGTNAARLGFSAYFQKEKLGVLFCGKWVDSKVPFSGNGHTTKYMIPKYKYWKSNPEYFAHDKNGNLIISRHLPHICMSNQNVKKICKKTVLDWIAKFPCADFFFVAQEDLNGWCECARCRAEDPFPGKKMGNIYTHLSDRVAGFINPIAKAVKDKDSNKRLLFIAYREAAAPLVQKKLENNIRVVMCSSPTAGCPCKSHSLSCWKNKRFLTFFKQWQKVAPGQLYIWNYCMNFKNRYSPIFTHDSMTEKLKFYYKNGVKGMFYNGAPRLFVQLFCYVQGKLLWNPGLNVQKLENDFINVFYGPAAPAMKDLLKLIRSRIHDKYDPVHQGEYASFDPVIEPEYLKKAYEIFTRAENAVKYNPKYLNRVRYDKLAAVLMPDLDSGLSDDEVHKLDVLKQMAEVVNQWQLFNIKGGRTKLSSWIYKKLGFKIKYSGRNWTQAPLIKELLRCKNKKQLQKFSGKIRKLEAKTFKIISPNRIKFLLSGFKTRGAGFGPEAYSHQCKKRIAIGALGGDLLETSFPLSQVVDAQLKLTALDHDKEGATSIQILMNGYEIFKGDNKASKTKWTDLFFPISSHYLKKNNTLIIKNLEKNEAMRNWILFADAEIILKTR